MAKLVQTPQKYLPSQWHASNAINFSKAENERARAEHLRAECVRLLQETDSSILRAQDSNSHKFSQRIREIQFWRAELERTLSENQIETDLLLECKQNLEDALQSTQFPLQVANSCLSYRQARVTIDNVLDPVETELNNEVKVIQRVQEVLVNILEQTTEQIRVLRSCKYKLEKDLTDKLSALGIDDGCAGLSDTSQGIGFTKKDTIKIQSTSVSPEEWASSSNKTITGAEAQRQASSTLRGQIEAVLQQTRADIEKQRALVNLEFSKRIAEVSTVKNSLEESLAAVISEIGAMEGNIESLQEAIANKAPPMMLSHTRLDLRSERPQRELVRDPVQYGLISEVGEIAQSVELLTSHLADSQSALKGLIRNQLSLQEDIEVKSKSLSIDQDQCMGLREQLDK